MRQVGERLPKDGSGSMKGDLDMNNNKITNLADPQPSDSSYAASVNFVNNTVNGSNVIINGVIDKKIKESEERAIRSSTARKCFRKSYGR